MTLGLTIDRLLKSTPERLYEVWTTSAHLTRWFGVRVDADAREGGELAIYFEDSKTPLTGRFTALRPYNLVAFTWLTGGVETQVTVTFTREGEMTRLTLKHEGFASEADCADHREGWYEYFELWAVSQNVGPAEGIRMSCSGFLPDGSDVPAVLANWLGKTRSEIDASPAINGTRFYAIASFAAQWHPSPFGISLAVTEWGLASESERQKNKSLWLKRFHDASGKA